MDWSLKLDLNAHAALPMYRRIARAIAQDIEQGRLGDGTRLPGTRRLADTLGVHRTTTLAAYRELAVVGCVDSSPSRGTFVTRPQPEARALATVPKTVRFALPEANGPSRTAEPSRDTLAFSHLPPTALSPRTLLGRAYRRTLARHNNVLGYASHAANGVSFGHPRLRTSLAQMVSRTRGFSVAPSDVLVTNGSQMGLFVAAQVLITPGDVIAVEALGYRPAWEAFRAAGAVLVPVPTDAEGMRVDLLPALAAGAPLRAIYVTPHHQHPTGVSLSAPRRRALLAFAEAGHLAVLEDDYDHEFSYDGRMLAPLASADRSGVVVHFGSLSKRIAPGIRMGYTIAPAPMLQAMAERRCAIDRQGDDALALTVAALLNGELQHHHHAMEREYLRRRDVLVDALTARFGDTLAFDVPTTGTALWVHADSVDVDAWHRCAVEHHGVSFTPGRQFRFDGEPSRALRLGFAGLDVEQLEEAVIRLGAALREVRNAGRRGVHSEGYRH